MWLRHNAFWGNGDRLFATDRMWLTPQNVEGAFVMFMKYVVAFDTYTIGGFLFQPFVASATKDGGMYFAL